MSNLIDQLVMKADLPGEYPANVPLVEIAGHSRVFIENHLGICGYSKEMICVKVKYGCIFVQGCRLELSKMNRYQLVITGEICTITLDTKG